VEALAFNQPPRTSSATDEPSVTPPIDFPLTSTFENRSFLPISASLLEWSFPWSPTGEWPELENQFCDLSNPGKQSSTYQPTISDFPHDLGAELQSDETSFFNFPDDHILEVPSLTLLNAAMKVAQRLSVAELIWDMSAISPFFQSESSRTSITSPLCSDGLLNPFDLSPENGAQADHALNHDELPSHLRPTPTQRMIPHHPLLDLLPWPETRDKFIQVFNLPVNLRPQSAQDPLGLARLVYDIEDPGGEGLKICGQNPIQSNDWEIGQLIFERWWWAFDTDIVERSNRAREVRGEQRLRLKQ
jgi:hypothetical protein